MTAERTHRKFTGGKKRGKGAAGLTVDIYRVVKAAGDEGLTVDEIHRQLDSPAFRSATAAWGESIKRPKSDSTFSWNPGREGRERIRRRTQDMTHSDPPMLISDHVHPKRGGPHYTAASPPRGYRPKNRTQNPWGWYEIDVDAGRQRHELHRDRVLFLEDAEAELAKPKARAAKMRPLLEEAVRLIRQLEAR